MSKLHLPTHAQERRWFDALQRARTDRQRATERRLKTTIRKAYRPLVAKVATLCAAQDHAAYPLVRSQRRGMRGLTKAIESYHLKRRYRFLTYAVWCIRKAIKGKEKQRRHA